MVSRRLHITCGFGCCCLEIDTGAHNYLTSILDKLQPPLIISLLMLAGGLEKERYTLKLTVYRICSFMVYKQKTGRLWRLLFIIFSRKIVQIRVYRLQSRFRNRPPDKH